jgi:hypothetical protein
VRHAISVARLRELLQELHDDDELQPNLVYNLTIVRGKTYAGFIDLLDGRQHVEWLLPEATDE